MNVKLAAQLLSATTSALLKTYCMCNTYKYANKFRSNWLENYFLNFFEK